MNKTDRVTNKIRRAANELGAGGRLPSFRTLMRDLGASQATVAAAVRRLQSEGLLESRPGSGLYVTADTEVKPILLICDSSAFIAASPFWEMFMEGLLAPYKGHPEGLVIEFTTPSLAPHGEFPISKLLSESAWARIRARAFGAVMLACPDERLGWEIERLGIPVVSFGCPSHHMVRIAWLEVCSLGVSELVRRGCGRITLYNAPHIGAKEVFLAALSAHGASECVVPPTLAFRPASPQLGQRPHLVESGLREAARLFGPQSVPSERPDGILAVDDMFAQGFLMGLQRYGLHPGRDFQMASHTNRGSPVLAAWQDDVVALELSIREIADALNTGARLLASGDPLSSGGWERSVLVHERQGELRTLTIRPTVRRPAQID